MRWTCIGGILGLAVALSSPAGIGAEIKIEGDTARLEGGTLTREIRWDGPGVRTMDVSVAGEHLLARPGAELVVTVHKAQPNQRPVGLGEGEGAALDSVATFARNDRGDPARWEDRRPGAVRWVEPVTISSDAWGSLTEKPTVTSSVPGAGVQRLTLRTDLREPSLGRLEIALHYEVYEGHAAIRKWIEVRNQGDRWLKLDRFTIDDLHLAEALRHQVPLTPSERGALSSVIAHGDAAGTRGVIAASEVPSALRSMRDNGGMGYREELFEWVLGPGEMFVSEPVFLYAFAGEVRDTPSARSTPLDRTVEGPYQRFLHERVGIAADTAPLRAPQWMTWAVFYHTIDDAIVRSRASLAARAGFAEVLLDDGWQQGRLGTEIDRAKFPDFAATSRFIREQGPALGLWLSCYRTAEDRDRRAMPEGRSLPVVTRLSGQAMSFSSPWRHYYAADLVRLRRELGATYFKQDFSNIQYGDFAEGHEGRSMRDSMLRGLRGLLEAQDLIRAEAPDVVTELTHEIYWGTPGVPCDLAALKHACRYHIPPNSCRGADGAYFRRNAKPDADSHRAELILGCYEARQRFYAHRGLPLDCLEFYGAATHSIEGSLTPAVQDRQVVSFLMGAPLTFSGDLATLSEENLAQYRKRFDLLKRLQDKYDIYRHFQFSGVPAPTDTDWHWWGKLNAEGCGAVVVVRGSGGAERRAVNIPWTDRARRYRVTACMSGADLGEFTGAELQDAGVQITLPALGQEILEVAAP